MSDDLLARTTEIVTAYFANGGAANMSPGQVPEFIESVHASLRGVGSDKPAPMRIDLSDAAVSNDYRADDQEVAPSQLRDTDDPAVPIKDSVTDDFLICLEDGHKTKLLKRYLRTKFDMTPEQYRKRWNLPSDYPFTAPEYSKRRAGIAKDTGLGVKGG